MVVEYQTMERDGAEVRGIEFHSHSLHITCRAPCRYIPKPVLKRQIQAAKQGLLP